MCLGSRTTQSPAASNTNYFGTSPWIDTPGGTTPDITPPAVTTTAQGGSTGSSNLKIGSGKKREAIGTGPGGRKGNTPPNSVKTGGVNY